MLLFIFLKPKVIKVFIIIFDQFNESLLRKSINLFFMLTPNLVLSGILCKKKNLKN